MNKLPANVVFVVLIEYGWSLCAAGYYCVQFAIIDSKFSIKLQPIIDFIYRFCNATRKYNCIWI